MASRRTPAPELLLLVDERRWSRQVCRSASARSSPSMSAARVGDVMSGPGKPDGSEMCRPGQAGMPEVGPGACPAGVRPRGGAGLSGAAAGQLLTASLNAGGRFEPFEM